MSKSRIEIRKNGRSLALHFDARDWKVLHHFLAFRPGVSDFFGDLGFMERGSIQRDAARLLAKAREVWAAMSAEEELLSHDYSFELRNVHWAPRKGTGVIHGLRLEGRPVSISAKPGHCWLELWTVREDGVGERERTVDLRAEVEVQLDDDASVTVGRSRCKGLAWATELPKLIGFLEEDPQGQVEVENAHTA